MTEDVFNITFVISYDFVPCVHDDTKGEIYVCHTYELVATSLTYAVSCVRVRVCTMLVSMITLHNISF